MKDWLDSLESRERSFVIVGSILVFLVIVYTLVWQPVATAHADKTAEVALWQRSFAELQVLKNRTPVAPNQDSRAPISQAPLVVVDQTLRERELSIAMKRSSPAGNGIRVEFENVAFDEVIVWLGDLSSKHNLHVTTASISNTRQSGPGRVNAVFTLERAL